MKFRDEAYPFMVRGLKRAKELGHSFSGTKAVLSLIEDGDYKGPLWNVGCKVCGANVQTIWQGQVVMSGIAWRRTCHEEMLKKAKKRVNLRGKTVKFELQGKLQEGVVVTHIRNERWMVSTDEGRVILPRHQFEIVGGL